MAELSKYCKAYPVDQLRAYPHWHEKIENIRPDRNKDEEQSESAALLTDTAIFYLHDNYVVTDSIQQDEYIIFDDVTEEWKHYCQETLAFNIPDFELS